MKEIPLFVGLCSSWSSMLQIQLVPLHKPINKEPETVKIVDKAQFKMDIWPAH